MTCEQLWALNRAHDLHTRSPVSATGFKAGEIRRKFIEAPNQHRKQPTDGLL
ncbi:hypothetical protein M3J09_000133 [Ascochyta lentis]